MAWPPHPISSDRVITRCITWSVSAPAATIPVMPGDLERLPTVSAGPAAVAAELTGRIRAELPVIGELAERDQVLEAAWLTGCGRPGPAAPTPAT